MFSRRDILRSSALATVAMPFIARTGFAQEAWPTRDIHAICGFPPGTGADVFVRWYARKLQDACGRTVVVENKVGAFGNISTEYVAKSKPDGYTLFIAPGSSFLAAAPSLFKSLSFDPIKDFDHITTLNKLPFVLVVAGDGPVKTVSDLTERLRTLGDKGSYGSVANTGLISSELYKSEFGLKTVEVKYKDTGAMLNDLWGGNIAFAHLDPVGAAAHVKTGKLRAIATSSREKFKALPDVPSAAEAGITKTDVIGWWSVHTPKGTPQPVLDKYTKWFNDIVLSDEHVKFIQPLGCDPFPGNAKVLMDILLKDTAAWKEYVKLAKIEVI